MVPPGRSLPFSIASLTIYQAALSFTEPPGFWNSAFPKTSHPVSSEGPFNLTKGVLPISFINS